MTAPPSKETIFFAALDLPSAEERAAYLDGACAGNGTLRRQIDRLLASHGRAEGFLERPVREVDVPRPVAPGPDTASVAAGAETERIEGGPPLDFLALSPRPDALGRLGHYDVLDILGYGGMGVVLRAFDEKLHRVVAIKVLSPLLATVGPARRRFVREARSAASVIHDNVIAIHAVEDAGPVPFLVMPFIDGPTLQAKLDRTGPLPVVEILRLGMQTAAGLAAAHVQGLVHRDVKPGNILLENGVERVKITDFGLARTTDDPGLTQPGLIAGTPAYMSPEQANGEPVDHRGDLFSLGSVLYALGTGRAPFRAPTMMAVLKQVCDHAPPPVRDVNPEIPDWLAALIARLHAKNPADRPQSAAEVADLLGRYLAHMQQPTLVAAPPVTGRPASVRPRRVASRWLPAVAAVVVLTVGLGAADATGVTNVRGTVVRLLLPDGTLVVEVDDPAVSVTVDGTDTVVTGAGVREIRLKPGAYQVRASKDGKVVQQELITVHRDGRRVVRVSNEGRPASDAEKWEESVIGLPAEKQVKAVAIRLRELNPGFDGKLTPEIEAGVVVKLRFQTDDVGDISAVHALRGLRWLACCGSAPGKGKVAHLTPLLGLSLNRLECSSNPVVDLEPVRGMPLTNLDIRNTRVSDLSPLTGMALRALFAQYIPASDVTPLRGMPMVWLDLCGVRGVSDIGPVKGMPLTYLNLCGLRVTDLSPVAEAKKLQMLILDDTPATDLAPIRGLGLKELSILKTGARDLAPARQLPLRSIRLDYRPDLAEFVRSFAGLEIINDKPVAEFWKTVATK